MSFINKKLYINTFICLVLSISIVDALPVINRVHAKCKSTIRPIINFIGIWQGTWDLFAPEVDKVNYKIVSRIKLDDDRIKVWETEDWSKMRKVEKFINFRKMEYYDSLANSDSEAVWNDFCEYLKGNCDSRVKEIEVECFFAMIPTPSSNIISRPYLKYKNNSGVFLWNPND